MRTITRLYNRVVSRAEPLKYALLFQYEQDDGTPEYKATACTLTGGSVWHGGKFSSEERLFCDRESALEWIGERVQDGKILEIGFI